MIGIYTITNIATKKVYVGESINIETRMSNHLNKLRLGVHKNRHLQNSFEKYGEKSFSFELLEECDEKFLKSQENYWCNILNVHNRNFGYNIDPTSPSGITRLSEETKNLISSTYKIKYINGYVNPRKDKKCTQEHKDKIGKSNSVKLWSSEHRLKMKEIFKLSEKKNEAVNKFKFNKIGTGKDVFKYDLDRNFIEKYNSINEAIIKNSLSRKSIYNCCVGKSTKCKGAIYSFNRI